jgi:hypothetical protein
MFLEGQEGQCVTLASIVEQFEIPDAKSRAQIEMEAQLV